MADKPYRNEEWLREQYFEKGLSMPQMARKADCTKRTIINWMDKYDIERRSPGEYSPLPWIRP